MRFDAGKVAAQSRKRAHACARHAPRRRNPKETAPRLRHQA